MPIEKGFPAWKALLLLLAFLYSLFSNIRVGVSLLGLSSLPLDEENINQPSSTAQAPTKCNVDSNSTNWRIVVTGNSGYEQDLLTWWYHCHKVGFCPTQDDVDSCRHTNTEVVFYAEDEQIWEKYHASRNLIVKKSWEVSTKFQNTTMDRFSYAEQKQFFQMMSRRPSIVLEELHQAAASSDNNTIVVFCDLDIFMLQDPRPYFVGNVDMWGADAHNKQTGPYNAGFLALKPSMIPMIEQWKHLLEQRVKPSPNQISFNNLLKKRFSKTIKHKLLPKDVFLVGKTLKKAAQNQNLTRSTLPANAVVFHNNWCEGTCNKTQRAMDLGIWHPAAHDTIMGNAKN